MKFLPGKKTLPKELKTILAFTFIFSLINLLVFSLIFRFSLKTILANLASENAQLKLLSEELEKRNEEYKEIRTANDIKLFRQLIALRRDIANTLNDGEKILGAESQDASSSAKMSALLGILTISEKRLEKIEVFAEPRASSKIIGEISTAEPMTIYFYTEKVPGWYKIEYKEGRYGWISEQFIEELYD